MIAIVYALLVVVVLVCLARLKEIIGWRKGVNGLPLPPGKLGMRHFKEATEFFQDVTKWALARKQLYGNLFSTNVFFMNSIGGGGTDFNSWWSKADNKSLIMKWPPAIQRMFGDRSIMTINGDEHTKLRKNLVVAFTPRALEDYLKLMEPYTMNFLRRASVGSFHAQSFLKQYTFLVGCNILLGSDFGSQNDKVLSLYTDWWEGASCTFALNLPFTAFRRSMRAREALLQLFKAKVTENTRYSPSKSKVRNVSEILCDPSMMLTVDEVANTVLVFLSAGHETTASGISSLLLFLYLQPEVCAKLRSEIDSAMPDSQAPLDYSAIKSLKYLDAVVKEALRLVPPFPVHIRSVGTDTELNGYAIPKGFNIVGLPCLSHFDEEVYPSPQEFLPERWLNSDMPAHSFFTFGDGPRQCLGMDLARVELKVFVILVLHNFAYWKITNLTWKTFVPFTADFNVEFVRHGDEDPLESMAAPQEIF